MKKFILSLLMVFTAIVSVNAQTAIETSKWYDNTYFGITGGATTPLNFSSVFPVNPTVGIKIGKEFTPVVGLELEGLTIFNNRNWFGAFDSENGTNLNLNLSGVINLTNALFGYKGVPRVFEIKTNTGIGWLHNWNVPYNDLSAKTGVDLQFNMGKTKAHSLVVSPYVLWNLTGYGPVRFNKNYAQFGLALSYLYHFKTSNGTRHFKVYDIAALNEELRVLQARLDECHQREPQVVVKEVVKEVVTEKQVEKVVDANKWVVSFANNSYALTPEANFILNQIGQDAIVDVVATASETGTDEYNLKLSQKRADAVANYLTKRGLKVNSAVGKGKNAETGRTATVSNVKK